MPRYVFTRENLKPLSAFLGLPMARQVVQAAIPIKRFPAKQVEERLELAVAVQNRSNPDGVPLDAILEEAKKASPSVTGIVVRGNAVFVTHNREPKPEEKTELGKVLLDKTRLSSLVRPELKIARAVQPASAAAQPTDEALTELKRVLSDPATPDDKWLREFRRFAVEHLLK